MLASGYAINTGACAMSGTTAKTICDLICGTNTLIGVTEISCSTDGVTASAVPGVLDFFKSTEATAGTAGGSSIRQMRGPTRTTQVTAGYNYSAEPTVLTAYKSYYVPQYNGLFILQTPLGREPQQITTAQGIGFRYTPTANVNVRGNMEWEEG